MLITFISKASASILMLGKHALPVLEAAGKRFEDGVLPERGVFTPDQLPAAIAGLKAAMDEAPVVDDEVNEDDPDAPKVPAMSRAVGFKQRAYPLYEMLVAAQKQSVDVMWEPAETAW
ncbi:MULTISPECIES: DUF1840 domain-containing protein [Paenalcaligenes]|uniref:DUF1840 domain-containing protein n=1 Tax=Paenalcaligenes hermetiae TaxID=1157987 RepID=A0ABP9M908_9BURK|nr:DUF1840 domain-containing protein [Paenalcaligenes sp.]